RGLRIGQVFQLPGQHVPRFEIRHDQNVGLTDYSKKVLLPGATTLTRPISSICYIPLHNIQVAVSERPMQCTHEALYLCTSTSRAQQSFLVARLTVASHRQVLGQERWRLTQGGTDTFHEVAEPLQEGPRFARDGGLAQSALCLKKCYTWYEISGQVQR